MTAAFNTVSKPFGWLKDQIGKYPLLNGWAIYIFLASSALAASLADPTGATTMGIFNGAAKQFMTPIFTASTYTKGVPILAHQFANSAAPVVKPLVAAVKSAFMGHALVPVAP